MNPVLFKEFCEEFTREVNSLRLEAKATLQAARALINRIDRDMVKLVDALIAESLSTAVIKERSSKLEAGKTELENLLARAEEPPNRPHNLHPEMARFYRQQGNKWRLSTKRFRTTERR
jgi:site-specific DNA recombinase